MNWRHLLFGLAGLSAGALVYGALVESNRLVIKRVTLRLPRWPKRLHGLRLAVVGDLHIRDTFSFELAKRAIATTLDEEPDMVALVGDFVARWKPRVIPMLGEVLEPMLLMNGNVVACAGNHEYFSGTPEPLVDICDELNIRLLRNENWLHQGIQWVGVDSANAGMADVDAAFHALEPTPHTPTIVLWHEPDVVADLCGRGDLMLSGHSHGGQFLTPWGQAFVGPHNGRKYRRGFYPETPTPLFVTSGVGTTGPPSRLFCPPEVVILTLESTMD